MSRFCSNCGTSCDDQATVCTNCQAPLQQPQYQAQPEAQPQYQQPQYQQPQYQQPYQQPQYQQPPYQQPQAAPSKSFAETLAGISTVLKKHIKWVMVGVASIALIFFVLYTFTLNTGGIGILVVFNILAGLLCLGGAALAAHGFVKNHMNLTFLPFLKDQPKTYPGSTEFLFSNLAVAAASLILVLGYLIFGRYTVGYGPFEYTVTVSAPVISWVLLFLFAAIAAVDFFVLRKYGDAPPMPTPQRHQPKPRPQYQQPQQPYAPQQPQQPYAPQQPAQPYAPQQPAQPYAPQQPAQPYAPQQPPYQAPQYQQPQYQAPQYQQPQYQAPQYQQPQYQAPQYQQPQYQAPQYQQPQYQAPQYRQPRYQQPQYQQPPQQPPYQQPPQQ